MELYVLNEELTPIAVIDSYKSLIWTTRYYSAGDFELYLPASHDTVSALNRGNYIYRPDNERLMIIKKMELETDIENGNFLIISGPSIESILHQRIVWTQTNLSGKAEVCLRRLITENVISPTINSRIIPNFILGTLNGYSETLNMQTTGDHVDDVIKQVCTTNKWGWKVTLNKNSKFVFDIFKGNDRGVKFSPEFDNLMSSNYQFDKSDFANVVLIAGEGEGLARKTATVGAADGLYRYEIFIDARDVSSNDEEISDADYAILLKQRGAEQLTEHAFKESFESEVEPEMTYKYKVDYDLGDVVSIENEYGITATSRIIEIIESHDDSGYRVIPTFEDWSV